MLLPVLFKPFAYLWFGISNVLGAFVPKIVLSAIYLVFVVPVGVLRKLFGKDNLQLRKFRKETHSVFKIREHTFTEKDIKHPY